MRHFIAFSLTLILASIAFAQIGNDIVVRELLPVVARTTVVGTYGSYAVDRKNFNSAVVVLHSAASTAGTGTSFVSYLQESAAPTTGTFVNRIGADTVANRINYDSSLTKRAVMFTQSGARQINGVTLWMKRTGTLTGKYVIVTLQTNSGNKPTGTNVTADAIDSAAATAISASVWTWVSFTFQKPVDVANSTAYHFVVEGDWDTSATNYVSVASETVSSGGNLGTKGAAWKTMSTTQSMIGFAEEYNFATVSGQTMDTVTEASPKFQSKAVDLRPRKQYLRTKTIVAGSSASFVGGEAIILGEARYKPAQ